MGSTRALARLRDPDDPALVELARLVVDEATSTPLREVASPRWMASQIATALEALSRGDLAREWVERRIDLERDRLSGESRTLRSWLPEEVEDPLRELLGRPWSPDEDLVFRLIDQAVVRDLVREILTSSLTRFVRRLRRMESGLIGGAGGRAARSAVRRGRGLLGSMANNLGDVAEGLGAMTGGLGDMAENLVGAVAEEVEHALDSRVKEYVSGVMTETVRHIAGHLASPEHAEAYGELRLAMLDVILDTPLSRLTEEADKLDPEEIVDLVITAIRSLVSAEDFVDRTEARVRSVLDEAGDGTLGDWLDEVGLAEVWAETTTDLVVGRLRAVVVGEAFAAWWEDLHAEE